MRRVHDPPTDRCGWCLSPLRAGEWFDQYAGLDEDRRNCYERVCSVGCASEVEDEVAAAEGRLPRPVVPGLWRESSEAEGGGDDG